VVRTDSQGFAHRESQLRAEITSLKQQVQRAYQRLVSDEDQLGRVRRALEIAMAVLDEGQGDAEPSSQTPRLPETQESEDGPSSVTPVTEEPTG